MYKILFIDDEPASIFPLRLALESRGFECSVLTDMTSALDYLGKEKVSVIVSDIMMPSGSKYSGVDSSETGFHLVTKIREMYPDIGVICLSVIGDQEKIQRLKTQGVLYLRKGETPLETAVHLVESKATGIIRDSKKIKR